ncbi:hypothetical protein [Nakamurella sp.]|uniref:hypothetical protein n=1 Tax=Nakamurella sp. TaxID=1869182 RepID=UPI003B3B8ED0
MVAPAPSEPPEPSEHRPAWATLLAVLLGLIALLQLLVAGGVLSARGDDVFLARTGLSAATWLWVATGALLLAAGGLVVARQLLRGGRPTRALAGAAAGLAGVALAVGGWGLVAFAGNLQWSSILIVALALMALGLLWSNRSAVVAPT